MSTDIFKFLDEDNEDILQNMRFESLDDLQNALTLRDPFSGIRTNKIRLGEDIRGMTNVHPFVSQAFYNRTASDISKYYFPDAEKEFFKAQGISYNIDVDCDSVRDLLIDSKSFFIDRNSNKIQDEGEPLFTFHIYASKNAKKLEEAFQCVNPAQGEILLFVEDNTGDLSKQWVRIKIANNVRENLRNNHLYDNTIVKAINQNVELSQDHLKQLVEIGQIEEKLTFNKGMVTSFWYLMMAVFSPFKAVGWIVSKIGEGLDFLKLPDKVWDTQHEDYLFDKDNLTKLLSIDVKKFEKLERDLNTKAPEFSWYDLIPDFVKEKITNVIAQIKALIDKWNIYVAEQIRDKFKISEEFQIKLAGIIGLYNGLVDFVASILQFIGALAEAPFDVANSWQEFLETIDNILLSIKSIDLNLFFSLPLVIMTSVYIALKDTDTEDLDWVRIAYVIGFAVAFVGTMFIPIAGWIGKIAKLSKFIPEELLVLMQKGLSYTKQAGKNVLQSALRTIESILEIFAKGRESILEFINKLKDIIVKWFKKNLKSFEKINNELLDRLKKDSKADELFRDISKKFLIKNKGNLTK